jgi:hypothetical protein
MATVNITEILGTDSISGSRVTINSNFLILQNWINGYITVFGIDSVNGILDLSSASTGKVQAKMGSFDSISVPSSGTTKATILNTGYAGFVDVQTTTLTASGAVVLNGAVTFGTGSVFTVGGTASFNGSFSANAALNLGTQGHIVSANTTYKTGLTAGSAFPANTSGIGGGGYVTSVNSPYAITGLEDVIYANCGPTGFYMKVVDGTSPVGGTLPNIPQGTRITIVNTSAGTGYIYTGLTGTSSTYYTGFNTSASYGGYSSSGITLTVSKAYRSSVTLQWESRIGQGQATQNGSWIVLSSTNATV